jgi:phage-related protein
MYNIEF